MNNDDFKEVPDNIQDNKEDNTNNIDNTNDNKSNDTRMSAISAAGRRAWQAR